MYRVDLRFINHSITNAQTLNFSYKEIPKSAGNSFFFSKRVFYWFFIGVVFSVFGVSVLTRHFYSVIAALGC